MTDETFETRVLVSLERIEGRVNGLDQKLDGTVERLDKHEVEIGALRRLVYQGVGAAVILATIAPMALKAILAA